jgi:hypothetical protein
MVMKDPKVTELVKQFEKDVAALNKTWRALQQRQVYVRLNVKGQATYSEPKYIEVDQITQHVEYMKEEK